MKKLMYVMAVAMVMIPVLGLLTPVYAQFDGDVDLSGILNEGRGGGNRGNNRGPQIPDANVMLKEIQDTLKKGKTPMDKAQEKPIQNLLNMEIVTLTDRIQLIRNNNNNNNNNNGFPNEGNRGGRGGGNNNNNQQQNQQQSDQAVKIDTITTLKNEDFLATKLSGFLTPEQVALVQKAHADDKSNSTCLGGMLDRYYQQLNNNRGNNNNNNYNNNNNNNNNNQTRPGGQKYCMTAQSTPAERLEPIRKVLAKGNLPLAKDKDMFAEVFMKAELQDLETALRAGLTNNNQGGGRGNNNNRNNNPQQIIQSSIDGMYKKVEDLLKPDQAATLKSWHYTQMLGRSPIDSLIAVNAMQDTPLSDEQIAKVTAAWPEYRDQIQKAAKAAGRNVDQKTIDGAAMQKILDMLEPSQVASYGLAKKYGADAVAK